MRPERAAWHLGRRGGRPLRARKVIALLAAALAAAAAGSCAAPEERLDVVYDARFGAATAMDVYLPEDDGRAHAAVLLIHGGAWRFGDRDTYDAMGRRLARGGWVAASIDYRMGDDGVYPRAVQDSACALSYLRNHAKELRVDPLRIAVLGYSAGGHLAALLGVAADHPSHAPDCAEGPTWLPAAVVAGAPVLDFRGKSSRAVEEFMGGTESALPGAYRTASPRFHAGPAKPPFLFVIGGADWFVDPDESVDMRDALRAAGSRADLLRVNGGGHLVGPGVEAGEVQGITAEKSPEAWLAILDFLERSMGRP